MGEIKVLHILGQLNSSGAETMLCISAPLFTTKNIQAEILSTGATIGSYAPQLAAAGYKLHHIQFSKKPSFFYKLYQLMRTGHYDVIHLHTERANFWIGLTSLIVRPGRVLRTIHNNFEFKGILRLRRSIQRKILHLLGLIHVSIGPSVERNELMTFGSKTRLVPNWYDNNLFLPFTDSVRKQARKALSIPPHETVIVTVGNCSKIKNHEALFRAIALLPSASIPIYLHVGNEEPDKPERNLAVELGIADRVHFLGPLTDIRPALQAADIFVMPSLFEGFSIAAIEALAMGLPAVFSDVPGLRDFRENYNNLCYVNPDTASLHAVLTNLLAESRDERLVRSKSYPEISQHLYSVGRGVDGYLEIYRGD